jgi:lysozyme
MDDNSLIQTAKQLIVKHEGMKTHLYKDSLGNLTIGIGYEIQSRGLPVPVINHLCDEDINYHDGMLAKHLWYQVLNKARKAVLLDMAFNLGQHGLMSLDRFITALQDKNYNAASEIMLEYEWAKQVKERAIEDAKIMKSGELS